MSIETVKVEGIEYNVAQASAVKQQELLSIIGHSVVNLIAMTDGEEIPDIPKINLMVGLGFSKMQEVAKIVLYKTVKSGGESVVSIDDFQGEIDAYNILVFEAVRANFQRFFTRLLSERKRELEIAKQLSRQKSIGS